MSTTTNTPIIPDLAHYSGGYDFSELSGLGPLYPHVAITPGVRRLADAAFCWWLVQAIAIHLEASRTSCHTKATIWDNTITFWSLCKNWRTNPMAFLNCKEDSGKPNLVHQPIPHTDFPFPAEGEFKLWVTNCYPSNGMRKLIILPGEY